MILFDVIVTILAIVKSLQQFYSNIIPPKKKMATYIHFQKMATYKSLRCS